MTYVLDTNIAFEIAFQGPDFNKYKRLLEEADSVLAPTLYESEVTNTLLKYIKDGYIDIQNAKISLTLMLQFVDLYTDTAELAIETLSEATRLNHSAYDIFYMVLARRNGATLLTKDERLKKLAIDAGVRVE